MSNLNGKQFRQQRLFNPLGVPRKQPHQMGLDEFAKSPRTWWHASNSQDFEDIRGHHAAGNHLQRDRVGFGDEEDAYEERDPGFHVGTLRAAHERVQARNTSGAYHPVRLNTEMQNTPRHPVQDAGEDWHEDDHDRYYHNDYEDPGSVSAILNSPHDVKTYADHISDALSDPWQKRIPSGEAQWRHDTGNTSFPRHNVVVQNTGEESGRAARLPGRNYADQEAPPLYRHELRHVDPRTGSPIEDEPIPRGFRGEQGFMFEGAGTDKHPLKPRPHLINGDQFT